MSVGGNVEVKSYSRFVAVQDLFVSGTLTTSAGLSLSTAGTKIYNSAGTLILSSSVGSTITVSGALDIKGGGANFPLTVLATAVSNRYVSIGNPTTEFFGFYESPTRRFRLVSSDIDLATDGQRIYNSAGHLILSSSVGSTVTVSGALDLIEPVSTIKNYSIRSTLTDLILSSSATSVVSISSSLRMISQTNKNFHIAGSNDLILSSSVGQVTISGAIDIENNGRVYDLRNKTGHLILSSSVGSIVRMSGALSLDKRTVATLPSGVDSLSGSVLWLTDTKRAVIYGPGGWTFIATGSAP